MPRLVRYWLTHVWRWQCHALMFVESKIVEMRMKVTKCYWGMMMKLVMLVECPVMTKTMTEQYLFACVLYYGQIESCWKIFEKIDVSTSFSKASGFIVYFLMILCTFVFLQIWNWERNYGFNSVHAFVGHYNLSGKYRKFNCFNNPVYIKPCKHFYF